MIGVLCACFEFVFFLSCRSTHFACSMTIFDIFDFKELRNAFG
jgi:hypothetical protein